jgi:DNA-binding transcriptional LysR family regulator
MRMPLDTRFLTELGVMSAVVDAGSFVRAGEALGLSQPAVSRAVQRIERHLNVRLFERSSHAVSLTDEGRRFYQATLPALAQLQTAVEGIQGSAKAVRGRLRVNVDATFARLVLSTQIGTFLREHPDVSVEIDVMEGLGDMVVEGYDVALRFGHPEASTLIARKLAEVPVVTCASAGYLKQHGRPKTPSQIATDGHECILFRDPATQRAFPWEFHQGKRKVAVPVLGRLLVNDGQTLVSACRAGLGIAQMFAWGIEDDLKRKRLVNLFPEWSDERWPLYAFYISSTHLPAKVRAFVDFIVSLRANS